MTDGYIQMGSLMAVHVNFTFILVKYMPGMNNNNVVADTSGAAT